MSGGSSSAFAISELSPASTTQPPPRMVAPQIEGRNGVSAGGYRHGKGGLITS
jgi:hypothetical protein